MEYLLGIDIGTSGTKTVLFDRRGNVIASAGKKYPLYQPQNGWAEQSPEDWWEASVGTIRTVLAVSKVNPAHISGIGLSGQMHGLVMVDKDGNPIRKSILWCDGRTGRECREVTERVGGRDRLIAVAANPALPGFTAGKILWVRAHEPELYSKCRKMFLPKDYVRFCLTGSYATDVSDASGTNLLDVPKRHWSEEILNALEIDRELLPDVFESSEITGTVSPRAAELTGLWPGTPVAGGGGDNIAAAIGTGVVEQGRAFNTIGTSGVIFAHSDQVLIDSLGRVHTFCHGVPGCWAVMSCTLSAGLSLKWLRDICCFEEKEKALADGTDPYVRMTDLASQSPVGANRLLFLPYLMGERSPITDEKARGAFVGLSASHNRSDMIRAVMEGVAYSQRQCLDILRELGAKFEQMELCGGGSKSGFWRRMFADLFGCPVSADVFNAESAALGAAVLAGVGAGVYDNVQEACREVKHSGETICPDQESGRKYEPYYRLYCQLYPLLKDSFHTLAELPDSGLSGG